MYTAYVAIFYSSDDPYEYSDNYVFCHDEGLPVPEGFIVSGGVWYLKDPFEGIVKVCGTEEEYDQLRITKITFEKGGWIDETGSEGDAVFQREGDRWVKVRSKLPIEFTN